MNDHDRVLAQELYFHNQKYPDKSDEYEDILNWVSGAVEVAGSNWTRKVKPKLREKLKTLSVGDDFQEVMSEQVSVVTGEKPEHFPMSRESVAGATFDESVVNRDRTVLKLSLVFAAAIYNARSATGAITGVAGLTRDQVKRYRRGNDMFYITQSKAGRNYAYQHNDLKPDGQVKGWISVATLDHRTSVICFGFANKYYPIKDYPTRASVPNQPPRHPNCRSVIVAVKKGDRLKAYQTDTADNFLHRNKQIAIDLMNEERYKLWIKSKTSVNNIIDLNRGVIFTPAQIRRRFQY